MALLKNTATTFKGSGRNRGRTCVKVKTTTKGKVLFRRRGVAFKDSGVRFAGCFSSAAAARAHVQKIKSGGSLKAGRSRKSARRGRRKK
ncbi:MAG TPA: hypothetical protein VEA38_03125 [Terriglobales bacterium]|nr:hypothetical protein [Terriglobales bacterium]